MPLKDEAKASFACMWIMMIGCIFATVLKSPFAFAFLFGVLYCFFGFLKGFGSVGGTPSFQDVEMRPLEEGRNLGDMTLGELMSKY